MRMPAGRAGACGARAATARPGSTSAARAPIRWWCTSRCGPIRWRAEANERREKNNEVVTDERRRGRMNGPDAHSDWDWRRQEEMMTLRSILFASVATLGIAG